MSSANNGLVTACLALEDGTIIHGRGFGAYGEIVGELCFNTAMTGYQEIMSDPSYAAQIITFTFPHIGNVGTNSQDDESADPAALGMVVRELPTSPSNWRSESELAGWMRERNLIGFSGVDTRSLTRKIRLRGMLHAAISHDPGGKFDGPSLVTKARDFAGLEGADLAATVSTKENRGWSGGRWRWPHGHGKDHQKKGKKVVSVDFGEKENILRCLYEGGCEIISVPATTSADEIISMQPDGLFLSNGPGDPAATGQYAENILRTILQETEIPIFGICLGHQLLARAAGAQTIKMSAGHHGANHPVRELATGRVIITSMNHGFTVDSESLPSTVEETHISLFDGSNCGISLANRAAFSVQYHPEASPGPHDSFYLFDKFVSMMC